MGATILRTNHLLLIAGPPCAGKTTLVSGIRDGRLSELWKQFGLNEPLLWTYRDATELARESEPFIDRLVVHYDLLAQRRPEGGYRHLPEIVRAAGHTVLLTVRAHPDSLAQRSRFRLASELSSLIRNPVFLRPRLKRLNRIWRRHRVLRSPASVARLYDDWFRFSSMLPVAAHWVLDSASGTDVDVLLNQQVRLLRRTSAASS
jgi:hypothetical protein